MSIFSIITVLSFLLMIPVTPMLEGIKFTPFFLQSAVRNLFFKKLFLDSLSTVSTLCIHILSQGMDLKEFFVKSLLAAIFYHAYQQVNVPQNPFSQALFLNFLLNLLSLSLSLSLCFQFCLPLSSSLITMFLSSFPSL